MQSLGLRASRAGKFAGGAVFLLALASTGAAAQGVYSGIFDQGSTFRTKGAEIIQDTRDFSITPLVGLQETFTDNALLTSTNQQADFITRPMVGAELNVRGPFTASVIGHAYYDAYINEGQLSGFSGDAQGTASYDLIPNFLAINANAMLMNTSVSTFGTPAINRIGPANQIQFATYDIGPQLTTTVDDFADLNVTGRFAQVFFGKTSGTAVGVPFNSDIYEGAAALDTGKRYLGYQSVTNAEVQQDNHDFQAYDFQQTFFVQIFPQVRLIGRGGYDNVTQPAVVNISAASWSGGLEYTINEESRVSVEHGERFGHTAWTGDLHVQISEHLFAEGRYFEAIQPDQLQINSSFSSFIAPTTQLPVQLTGTQFLINGNLDNQTALNKQGDLHAVYTWEGQSIELQGAWNDRMLLALNSHDRSLTTGVNYEREIAPDLNAAAGLIYYHTFANPFFGANETYGGNIGLQYDINSTMRAVGGYAYQRQAQLVPNGQTIMENVLFAAIAKKF